MIAARSRSISGSQDRCSSRSGRPPSTCWRAGRSACMRTAASLPRAEARGATGMDGIELEILWGNLISIVSEQAKALQRIAFSPIVREAGDLATALFDTEARMVAQAITGTPGHINSLGAAAKNMLTAIPPERIYPGDVLITNDPWLSAGHFFYITPPPPRFFNSRPIAYFACPLHPTPTDAATE